MDHQAATLPRDLTPPERATLRAIVALTRDLGCVPSVREIQQWTGASSTSVVTYRLAALERQGYIQRSPRRARAIRVLRDGEPS